MTQRTTRAGRWARGAPGAGAAALGLAAALATGGGVALAAPQPGQPGTTSTQAAPQPSQPGIISTVAGGVGGPATATSLELTPCGVASGSHSLYVGEFGAVRQVDPATGRLTTPAGTGIGDPLGDGGNASRASFIAACSVTLDHAGNLVIADDGHMRVRVVAARTGTHYGRAMTARHIYTVAGNGTEGFSGDGGPATGAMLDTPQSVAVDGSGNLVITDTANARIRVVAARTGKFYGQAMTAGDIYTVAGHGIPGFSGDGGPATHASLNFPNGVAIDGTGNLVIGDQDNDRVRLVAVRTGRFYGQAMTAGDIYTVAGNGIPGFSGDGGPATHAMLDDPSTVTFDGAGNLVLTDTVNNRVRVVAARTGTFFGQPMTKGGIYTVAGNGGKGFSGDGGPASHAMLAQPEGVTLDSAGNLVVADDRNNRVRVVAARTGAFYGLRMTAQHIYTIAGNDSPGFSGDGGPATRAQVITPHGVAVDGSGDLAVADPEANQVRLVPAHTATFFGRPMTAGHIYTLAGRPAGTPGFSGDGGPASRAMLFSPEGVTFDGAGNLIISDRLNNRVRVVAGRTGSFYGRAMTVGDIYTVAGNGGTDPSSDGQQATRATVPQPLDAALDHAGNLVIVASSRIRVVAAGAGTFYGQKMKAGDIYTIAGNGNVMFSGDGGPAVDAALAAPDAVAVDHTGNIVIADTFNSRIRLIAVSTGRFYGQEMNGGDIYTVAGGGPGAFSGDGGPATLAALSLPDGVAVDHAGNLVIADTANNRIRVVAVHTGTVYGQFIKAGDIDTVAGRTLRDPAGEFSGDGGPAVMASLSEPEHVVVSRGGDLVFTDGKNRRVRVVTG